VLLVFMWFLAKHYKKTNFAYTISLAPIWQQTKHPNTKGIKMKKSELISAVAATARITKADATRAVDAVITTITNELAIGGNVAFLGFGRFEARLRAERQGRN